ncbi:hypothetical protein T492DRAFT_853607 [Pavlovales sp. CCMP2436]|nr:hypothetical protein T492DRAFT_853607 [Pavlovales sp. CCMP2436]
MLLNVTFFDEADGYIAGYAAEKYVISSCNDLAGLEALYSIPLTHAPGTGIIDTVLHTHGSELHITDHYNCVDDRAGLLLGSHALAEP